MDKTITFDNFKAGWDVRKGKYVSDANRLVLLDNLYVTKGGALRQRPGIVDAGTLASGTQGFEPYNDKIRTFTSNVTANHGITGIENIDLLDEDSATLSTLQSVARTERGLYVTALMSNGRGNSYLVEKDQTSRVKRNKYTLPHTCHCVSHGKRVSDDKDLWLALDREGELWRSIDDGENWERMDVSLPGGELPTSVRLVYFNKHWIFSFSGNVGLGVTNLLQWSNDDGQTWQDAAITPHEAAKTFDSMQWGFDFKIDFGLLYFPANVKDSGGSMLPRIVYTRDGENFKYSVAIADFFPLGACYYDGTDFYAYTLDTVASPDAAYRQKIDDLSSSASWPAKQACSGAIADLNGDEKIYGPCRQINGRIYAKVGLSTSATVFAFGYSDNGLSFTKILDNTTEYTSGELARETRHDVYNNQLILFEAVNPAAAAGIRHVTTIDIADNSSQVFAVGSKANETGTGLTSTYTAALNEACMSADVDDRGNFHLGVQKTSNFIDWRAMEFETLRGGQAISIASKVFHNSAAGRIPFSATSEPLDTESFNDAGFLPETNGYGESLALANYQGQLAAFFQNAIQLWSVDPDPALMSRGKSLEQIGCEWPGSINDISGDKVFLSKHGFRTLRTQTFSGNLEDNDIGSPIDDPVILIYPNIISVRSEYFTTLGQYWAAVNYNDGTAKCDVFVFTYLRSEKINAWSRYRFTGVSIIDGFAELDGDVYFRSGNAVWRVDPDATDDDGTAFAFQAKWPMLDFKKPGIEKDIMGLDFVIQGACTFSIHTPRGNNAEQIAINTVGGEASSEDAEIHGIEVVATDIQPDITGTSTATPFQLDSFTFHYSELGKI